LKTVGALRSTISGIDLTFSNLRPRYDLDRDVVAFAGQSLGQAVTCSISREALDDSFGTDGLDKEGRVEAFLKNRSKIEQMARAKYVSWPIEEPGSVLIKTLDVDKLTKEISVAKDKSK
jgi:hypothetical protein